MKIAMTPQDVAIFKNLKINKERKYASHQLILSRMCDRADQIIMFEAVKEPRRYRVFEKYLVRGRSLRYCPTCGQHIPRRDLPTDSWVPLQECRGCESADDVHYHYRGSGGRIVNHGLWATYRSREYLMEQAFNILRPTRISRSQIEAFYVDYVAQSNHPVDFGDLKFFDALCKFAGFSS